MTEMGKWFKYPSVKKLEKLRERGRISDATCESYAHCIGEFCKLHKLDPERTLEKIRGLEDKETYFDDLIKVFRDKGLADSRIVNIFKAVRWWLSLNKVDVDWSEIILPSVETVCEDRAPTKEELTKILNVANLRDKALILVALSGLRRNTLVTLKVGDVNFDYPDVARIMVKKKYEVNGKTYTSGRKITRKRSFYVTFIVPEAKTVLLEYLESRRRLGEKITEESPLFTSTRHRELGRFLDKETIDKQWNRLLKLSGLTEKTHDWYVIHFHTLKKYAQTQLINAGVKPSYREFWLGHKGSYLETSYFRGEEKEHLEEFRKAIDFLSITESSFTRLTPQKVKDLLRDELAKRGATLDLAVEETSKKLGIDKATVMTKMLQKRSKKPDSEPSETDCQRIISESELEESLSEGWRYVATLPSGKILISDQEKE